MEDPVNWLTPFSITTGFALLSGYGLLGACWLIHKAEGDLQQRAKDLALKLLLVLLAFFAIVSIWLLVDQPVIAERWLMFPSSLMLLPLPLLSAFFAYKLWATLRKAEDPALKPLAYAMGLFLMAFGGLVAGVFPYIIPGRLTIWQAIAPDKTVYFTLIGILIFIPVVITYNLYAYRTFSGKTSLKDGY